MQIAGQLTVYRTRLAAVQQELEQLAQRQQGLLQEALKLTGAIEALEQVVVAYPAAVNQEVQHG